MSPFIKYGVMTSFGDAWDADAAAFFTAAGITDVTQKSAVNRLVRDLKGFGLWTQMLAVYPFVGGAASPHSYNLKNPAAFQITWSGTVTHDANGITGNGSTGLGDTGVDGSSLDQNSTSFGAYSRTNVDGAEADIGVYSGMAIMPRLGDTSYYDSQFPTTRITSGNGDSRGLFGLSRTGVNATSAYKNGAPVGTSAGASEVVPATDFAVLAASIDTTRISSRNIALAYVAEGLNDTENADLYTAIQSFQTALSRQV